MISIKETETYKEVIKEFDYSFGKIYVFDGFIVSEMNEGVIVNWNDHASVFVNDLSNFLRTDGKDLIFISNRINSYSVVAPDLSNFFKTKYGLKAFFIVSDERVSVLSSMIESLFLQNKVKRFSSLHTAINSVKNGVFDID